MKRFVRGFYFQGENRHMKQIRIIFLFVCTGYAMMGWGGQEEQVLSLRQCVEYASAHSGILKIADFEQGVARKKVGEFIGSALPQISASGTWDDNAIMATQLLPGEILGQPGTFPSNSA